MSSSSSFPNAYQLPNDFLESQRLDLQHQIWTKLIGGLYPTDLRRVIEERLRSTSDPEILDVGCGTGIWAIEMSKCFPEARVTGLDLTDWNLGNESLPKNYIFEQCDLAGGLPLDFSGRFDVIQCRTVLQHVAEPQNLVEDMARCLKPGGILLIADGELSQGSFDRSKKPMKPFIYDPSISAEQNVRRGDIDKDVSWLAGWLHALGRGLESSQYQRPDRLAEASKLLSEVKLRDIWMDVSWSEGISDHGGDQDVKEMICVNYVKAFNAVRPVLVRQGIPDSFIRDVWQPRILHELQTREFTSLWHYVSAIRGDLTVGITNAVRCRS